ncbi:MAG TPA: choice-of-anchor J domain-containing protein [Bacteroidales bacterium]|nr:choice-of-anchor J domain-containing protein [Bacteroidales bacterium]
MTHSISMKATLKTAFFALALIIFTFNANAQAVLYQQTFEDSVHSFQSFVLCEADHGIPADTSLSALADSAWVIRYIDTLNTYAALATSNYNPAAAANDWFITPAIPLGKASKLTFKAAASMAGPADSYSVYISTSQQDVNSCLLNPVLATYDGEPENEWTEHTLDLAGAGYASQQVYLGFRLHTQTGGNNLMIDDITVTDDSVTNLVALTFNVNMSVWIRDGKFKPENDSIDIVGNFNNWTEGQYMLIDSIPATDSIYTITIPGFTVGQHLEFKFRIDCSWADTLVEFPYGYPNRTWDIEPGKYTYSCYYNDEGTPHGLKENQPVMAEVKVFPNPFSNEIRIINPEQVNRVVLTGSAGQRIAEWKCANGQDLDLNLGNLPGGIYMLLFYDQKGYLGCRKISKF